MASELTPAEVRERQERAARAAVEEALKDDRFLVATFVASDTDVRLTVAPYRWPPDKRELMQRLLTEQLNRMIVEVASEQPAPGR